MTDKPNPAPPTDNKEAGEYKRVIHSLASVPREIAFMVTPQRSRRLCWPVSEDKIRDYIETEKFVDDELDPAITATLRSTIQQEQAAMDAIDNARSESSEEDENEDDQLRKYDTPVISLMPEYKKQRRLRKLKREEDYEEKLIENIELTVAYNDQQGPKMTQTMDPYLYKSKDSDIELRLLVQQLWHRLFEDVPNEYKNPTLDNTTTSFLILEAKNMLNELITTLLHLRRFGGSKQTLGLNTDWRGTVEDKRRRYPASTAGSWETVVNALPVIGMPEDFISSVTKQLESIYQDKGALDGVRTRLEKPRSKKNNPSSQSVDENGEVNDAEKEKRSKKRKRDEEIEEVELEHKRKKKKPKSSKKKEREEDNIGQSMSVNEDR
jgi:hypothetical protein